MKIEYINPAPYAIQLTGPNGERISVPKHSKIILSEWFTAKYPNILKPIRKIESEVATRREQIKYLPNISKKQINSKIHQNLRSKMPVASRTTIKKSRPNIKKSIVKRKVRQFGHKAAHSPLVGKQGTKAQATQKYESIVPSIPYSISSDIGIGILSYNRLHCIKRCINSIKQYTDLSRVTVFISDESTDPEVHAYLRTLTDCVVMINNKIGIAGNTNRLLRCLSRFKYGILLNDDVEIVSKGWEEFYASHTKGTGIHHFCYRQAGVYGATRMDGRLEQRGGVQLQIIDKKPHGAVMAFTNEAFKKVGYFDAAFGEYGIEHIDWSNRICLAGCQPFGYYDIVGSEKFFVIHNEKSAVKVKNLIKSKNIFNNIKDNKNRIFIDTDDSTKVDRVSYIIPFRDINRTKAINAVVNNIKAQLFPQIEIVIVEQDKNPTRNENQFLGCKYLFITNNSNEMEPAAFNKARAFNVGFTQTSFEKIILQDADILLSRNYTRTIFNILKVHDSCHIGESVLYLTPEGSQIVFNKQKITSGYGIEKMVAYFEGGSLACRRNTYIDIGGFDESFVGYGSEDCEFFKRIKDLTKFYNHRTEAFIHLFHDRINGWKKFDKRNKQIECDIYSRKARIHADLLKARLKHTYKV